ncbi:hypothetical protein T484DRAFT_1807681 [Baffinella frigidus]|nr:hypothetical protein T484DRAFT_1807681 [Cryptophyta sp. CCMP2293]
MPLDQNECCRVTLAAGLGVSITGGSVAAAALPSLSTTSSEEPATPALQPGQAFHSAQPATPALQPGQAFHSSRARHSRTSEGRSLLIFDAQTLSMLGAQSPPASLAAIFVLHAMGGGGAKAERANMYPLEVVVEATTGVADVGKTGCFNALVDAELNCPEAKTCGCKSATLSVLVNGNEADRLMWFRDDPAQGIVRSLTQ